MPDEPGRDAAFYDHENEPRRHVADWGGDDLFTRVPRRREGHTAPPLRFRRPAPVDPLHRPGADGTGRFRRDDGSQSGPAPDRHAGSHAPGGRAPQRPAQPGQRARDVWGDGGSLAEWRADASWLARADDAAPLVRRPDASPGDLRGNAERRIELEAPGGRRTVIIAGRPGEAARPLRDRRRPPKTVAARIGPRPERIMAWAFLLGLLLILLAIATADAATI
jgi:hypothetical protein